MKFFGFLVLLLHSSYSLVAQIDDSGILVCGFDISTRASFIGGEIGLTEFIADSMVYPKEAFNNNIEGTVNVLFTIDTLGIVRDVKTLGSKKGYGLEKEAIRVICLTSGMWSPARQRDIPVDMKFRLPIRFRLSKSEPANNKYIEASDSVYNPFDVLLRATFTGGEDSLNTVIKRNLEWPKEMGTVCGNFVVALKFVVNEDGTLSGVEMLNKVQFPELVREAKKALMATSGGWSPAYKNNRRVKMYVSVPISFIID